MRRFLSFFLIVFTALSSADPLYPSLNRWLFYEQKRMDTSVDPSKIISPEMKALPKEFRPETGTYFSLPSLWVPEDEWHSFQSLNLPAEVRGDIQKQEGGQSFSRLFVHPLSQKLYQPLIDKYGLRFDHTATPTSSARTLLVFPKDSHSPYFAFSASRR